MRRTAGRRSVLAALAVAAFAAAGLRAAPLVLLDPGHGGPDAGVTAAGFRESDFVLALAESMEPMLRARGLDVQLTRNADQPMSITARVDMANALQPAVLVSLHVNAAFEPLARGPRLFVPAPVRVDDPQAPLWTQAAGLHAAQSRALAVALARGLGASDPREIQTLKLALFRGLSVPACLVELEFASNPDGLAALTGPGAVQVWAAKLAGGIADFVLGPPAPAGAVHARP